MTIKSSFKLENNNFLAMIMVTTSMNPLNYL